MSSVKSFLSMLENGTDNALLRYSLGNAYFTDAEYETAAKHLKVALEHEQKYSAAWKMLGRSFIELDLFTEAVDTLQQGIAIAAEKGDKQAEKEMSVFLRRAKKKLD